MRHGTSDPTISVAQKPPVSIERELSLQVEAARAGSGAGLAGRHQSDLLEQDRERYGEAVIDGGVADPIGRESGLGQGAFAREPGADADPAGRRGDMLVR